MQIDNEPDRGFTYKAEGPTGSSHEPDGRDRPLRIACFGISKKELIPACLWKIRMSRMRRKIAEKILRRNRKSKAGWTTTELHEVIASALVRIPEKERKEAVKKASARTFQALRIDVNLMNLRRCMH
ncbi:MAG: 16S rRNA (cytosine(1402)-N(4))-methyltransferase [Lachnospiraceae bacterium]